MELGIGVQWLVEVCRSAEAGPAASFAGAERFAPTELTEFIPEDVLADLCDSNLIYLVDGQAQSVVKCRNHNDLVSVMPSVQESNAGYVHINRDTFWLLKLVWEHGHPGDYAVELGTGNGIVAAHMVARYLHVLATDLPGPWLKYAQLTLAANSARRRSAAVVACDVASALRPGHFDLVAANSPWSPAAPLDDNGKQLTFMAGGDTGTELPSRFLREGAELLRPGGTAIILCFDPVFEDGSRPLLPILDSLETDGYSVECIESEVFPTELVTERLRNDRLPTLKQGRHIAAIIRA